MAYDSFYMTLTGKESLWCHTYLGIARTHPHAKSKYQSHPVLKSTGSANRTLCSDKHVWITTVLSQTTHMNEFGS